MYEDSRDLDKSQDSDNESHSYPSYSRFTFTGKPKSRLGRHRSTLRKNDVKEDKASNSGDICSSETSTKSSFQTPKTPGINWLSRDASSLTNPFSGLNLFKLSNNVPDGQQSSNTGREIDNSSSTVPSQLNFFSALKSDSAQISNTNRNFTFNRTPFRGVGSCNLLNEQKQLTKTPIPKLDFSCGNKEENKENTERKLSSFNNQESSLDPSWNQLKKICDSAVSHPSTKLSENSNFVSGSNRSNAGRTTNDPFRPNVFPSLYNLDRTSDTIKNEDDSTNTPLDLSSGDSLTSKILFNKSVTGSDQSYGTVVSLGCDPPLTAEQKDSSSYKDGADAKPRNSSDAIDSILPVFLAPINKIKTKEFDADGKYNGKGVAASSLAKHPTPESKPEQSLPFAELPNPFLSVALSTSNCQPSSNKRESSLEKQNELKNDNEVQDLSQQRPSYQPRVIKDNVSDNIATKNVLSLSSVQPVKSASENRPDARISSHNDVHTSSKDKENFNNVQLDALPNSSTTSKLTPNILTEKFVPIESNQVKEVKNVDNNMLNVQTKGLNSNTIKTSTVQTPSPPSVTAKSEEVLSTGNHSEIPKSSERTPIHNTQNVVTSMRPNGINNVSKPIQIDVKHSESNLHGPIHPQPQIFPNNLHKVEGNLHNNIAISQSREELKIPASNMNVVEFSENHQKQYPVQQQYVPNQKQTLPTPDPMSFNQRSENLQKLPTYIQQQKTYLAPPNPSDNRMSNNGFPYKKPELPQQISSRPSFAMMDKPQNSYKMPPPHGRLPRASSELFVNGKAYTTLSILGKGGSSEVYQVLDPKSSKLLAVKCVDLSMVDRTIADGYLNEIDLLAKLQGCASVIKMFDYEYVQEYKILYVVLEKGDTDLSQLIRDISKTKKMSMSMIIYYWTEMLTAVRDIHEQGIIHSDLKPANFLLVSGRLKLIDFGIASSQGDMTSVVKEVTTGTWNYMSPEAIRNTSTSGKGFKITYKSDVWSLGCILYNLVYGKTPFSHITNTWGKLQAIADSSHQIDFPDVGAPLVLGQALRSCFHRDPKLRPTVAELLSLPYHATCDTSYISRQLHAILPQEWWRIVAHLFPDTKPEDKSEVAENKGSGTKADLT